LKKLITAVKMEIWRSFQCRARKVMTVLSYNKNTGELDLDGIMRFLKKAKTNPIIGHRFKDIKDSRLVQIGERMLALLKYAFTYDRIYPFASLFGVHTMMALTDDEVDTFFELLIKEAFTHGVKIQPSHLRILNRIKTLILHGTMKSISKTDIIQFQSIIQSNVILKNRFQNITTKQIEHVMKMFMKVLRPGNLKEREKLIKEIISKHELMWISPVEYEEFTKLFLELYEDRDFLIEAAPVRKQIGEGMTDSLINYKLQIWSAFNKNNILLKRFVGVEPNDIKIIILQILKLIMEYPKGVEQVKSLAISHVHLKLSELELMELERVFLSVKERTREYHAKIRVLFGDFSRHLRQHNGISERLFEEEDGGVLAGYDYYDLLSNLDCNPLITNLN